MGHRAGRKAAPPRRCLPEVGDRFPPRRQAARPHYRLAMGRASPRVALGTNASARHNALTPYLVEIMDALSEHSSVRQVTF